MVHDDTGVKHTQLLAESWYMMTLESVVSVTCSAGTSGQFDRYNGGGHL